MTGVPRRVAVLLTGVALALSSLSGVSAVTLSSASAASVPAAGWAMSPQPLQHRTVRQCAPSSGHMACLSIRQVAPAEPGIFALTAVAPAATPAGYGPASLASAYRLPTGNGTGQTVAIVDAYHDPNAASDLAVYRTQFGLPACTVSNGCFRQVNSSGATAPLPTADIGWAGEISLDLDMVSAICPNCRLLLVEATSAADADLFAAVDRAVAMGARFVSNSWGGAESSSETTDDSHFDHPGVAITVASGDDGTGPDYPATSRYVTAVGGTSLTSAADARGWSESAWSRAGSGCSAYDTKPTWQTVTTGCADRAESDVSAVADPNTGVAVYQTYGAAGWTVYGGTSAAAPIIAGVYALAGTPAAGSYPAAFPYSRASGLFDVVGGSNGSCGGPICSAGTGWDGPTGLGTPDGTTAFGGTPTAPAPPTPPAPAPLRLTNPGTLTGTVGSATSHIVTASGGTSPYTYSATGLPAGLTVNATTGVLSGKPTTAGTYSVIAAVRDATSATARSTFSWKISAAPISCVPAQLLKNPGFETGTAAPWTSTTGVVDDNSTFQPAHSGSWKAWLDGYGVTHTDTLTQSVTIPAACRNSSLSFYLHVDTDETTTATALDKLTVRIGSTTLATYSNLDAAAGYQLRSFNVGSFAGRKVTISISGTENNSRPTDFVVDDTAIRTR